MEDVWRHETDSEIVQPPRSVTPFESENESRPQTPQTNNSIGNRNQEPCPPSPKIVQSDKEDRSNPLDHPMDGLDNEDCRDEEDRRDEEDHHDLDEDHRYSDEEDHQYSDEDTGDKDLNTHQAHAGYIGSTDNK